MNALQSLAVRQVKDIADSFFKQDPNYPNNPNARIPTVESEAVRTALQALVGCAGAAPTGNCASGALGASSSVVLNNLITSLLQPEQRDAAGNIIPRSLADQQTRTALIATLTGAIAGALGANAGVASNAGVIETENNALARTRVGNFPSSGTGANAVTLEEFKRLRPDLYRSRVDGLREKYGNLSTTEADKIIQAFADANAGDVGYAGGANRLEAYLAVPYHSLASFRDERAAFEKAVAKTLDDLGKSGELVLNRDDPLANFSPKNKALELANTLGEVARYEQRLRTIPLGSNDAIAITALLQNARTRAEIATGEYYQSFTPAGRAQLQINFNTSDAQRNLRGDVAVRSANNELLAVAAAGPLAALAVLSIPEGLAYLTVEGGTVGARVLGASLIVAGAEGATGALTFAATGGRSTTGIVGQTVNYASGTSAGDTVSIVIQLSEGVYAVGRLGSAIITRYSTRAEAEFAARAINNSPSANLDIRPPLVVTRTTVNFSIAADLGTGLRGGSPLIRAAEVNIPYGFPIDVQGAALEAAIDSTGLYGRFLGNASKTFDFFVPSNGLATSTKTINTLTDAKLRTPKQVEQAAKNAVSDALHYVERGRGFTDDIDSARILSKQVVIAVPTGTTQAQLAALARAVDYGKLNRIVVKIVITGR